MSNNGLIPAYVLLIAINDVGVNNGRLDAPEPDAERLRRTLLSLGIPFTSIQTLTGPRATRSNIINGLYKISGNPAIPQDAPIIIYFAGHGTQDTLNTPDGGSRVAEFISPYDTLVSGVAPIPDITISALVGRIARGKSKHITLFFDCCHAGSASRGDNEILDLKLELDPDDFAKLDQEIWSDAFPDGLPEPDDNSRALSAHPLSFRYPGLASHTLIASCHQAKLAQEYRVHGERGQGLFTTALIQALEEAKEDNMLWSVTHSGLFERIKRIMQDIQREFHRNLAPQTPQCEGYHKDRTLFATPAFPHGTHAIAPLVEISGGVIVPLGQLAGVHSWTTFEVYDYDIHGRRLLLERVRAGTDAQDSKTVLHLGRQHVLSPYAHAVMCTPPIALPVAMTSNFLALYNDRDTQSDLIRRLGSHERLNHFISPVQVGQPWKLYADHSSTRREVELRNTHGGMLHFRNTAQMADALTKAVMFFHHLEQPNSAHAVRPDKFNARICELVPAEGPYDRVPVLIPRRGGANIPMNPAGECIVPTFPGADTSFGLEIENHAGYDFYVYVFYFDPADYSISPIYLPPDTGIPLPSRGKLRIGYGDSGARPLDFSVKDDQDKDTGFIKIYYSTAPTEIGFIQQDGFEEGRNSRPSRPAYSPSSPPFGSIVYRVTVTNSQRRR